MVAEFEFLARLRNRLPAPPSGQLWIGDDAAVLANGVLAATDALVDGGHFRCDRSAAHDIGWKAMAVNVSDIAAMGGTPTAALAAVVVPSGDAVIEPLVEGLADAADAFGCPLVGGDLTTGPAVMVTVAVLGTAPVTGAVTRAGARVGDTVFVTGTLGGPAAALRALERAEAVAPEARIRLERPTPRVGEGRAAASAGATAMIDVSDGFARDLSHICDESGVGVRIHADALPVGAGASVDDALTGGDDYELIFCAPDPAAVAATFVGIGLAVPTAVGEVVAAGRTLVRDGRETDLGAGGWEHQV